MRTLSARGALVGVSKGVNLSCGDVQSEICFQEKQVSG